MYLKISLKKLFLRISILVNRKWHSKKVLVVLITIMEQESAKILKYSKHKHKDKKQRESAL